MFLTGKTVRGCGTRTSGAMYICSGRDDENGIDIENFMLDPVIPWPGEFQRGVKIIPNKAGHNDLVVFIGKNFYPSVWSFVEEARLFGVSRKLANNIPVDKLTPGKSVMLFVHSMAIPNFDYTDISTVGPHKFCKRKSDSPLHPGHHEDKKPCAYSLKTLSALQHTIHVENELVRIDMPSFSYKTHLPVTDSDPDFNIGVFMALPITHFEAKDFINNKSAKTIEKSDYPCFVLDY